MSIVETEYSKLDDQERANVEAAVGLMIGSLQADGYDHDSSGDMHAASDAMAEAAARYINASRAS